MQSTINTLTNELDILKQHFEDCAHCQETDSGNGSGEPGGGEPGGGEPGGSNPPSSGWNLTFVYDDSPSFTNRNIPIQNFLDWDGTQIVDETFERFYYDESDELEMWANQPKDGVKLEYDDATATRVPFDGFEPRLTAGNAINHWGFDPYVGAHGVIYISGSTAGFPIPFRVKYRPKS